MSIRQVYEHYARAERWTDGFKYCPRCTTPLQWQEEGNRMRPTCPACGFVQYRNPAPAVSILVIDGDRALIGRRAGQPGQGMWALPSGYIEYDEDYICAAGREVKEETGLDVQIDSILNVASSFVASHFHFLSVHLVAHVLGGELAASDDLIAVDWFPIAGPLPPMGFQEDVDALALYASGVRGLPVQPDNPDRAVTATPSF